MGRIPPTSRAMFASAVLSAWEATALGVTTKNTHDRQKYWRHWTAFTTLTQTDPFLNPSSVSDIERDIVVGAFAALVRRGSYGRGQVIKVSGVTDALAAISKTIELAGKPSPIYRKENKYQLSIERLVEGFRRTDPPSVPQLAVPVTLAHTAYSTSLKSADPHTRHTGLLVMVAFYYLLRVGEYTKPRTVLRSGKRVPSTRTKQFTIANVGFFKDGKILPRTSTLKNLLSADLAVLKITNQKNGMMGQTITQHATGKVMCPVRALARVVHHILSNGGTDSMLLCSYYASAAWHTVEAKDIVQRVKATAKAMKLEKMGIDPALIGAHSLRAGGAMALKLHNYSDTTIMKMGRWTSLTFLQYIHNQIAHLSNDISKKMSMELPFVNVAAIEQSKEVEDGV